VKGAINLNIAVSIILLQFRFDSIYFIPPICLDQKQSKTRNNLLDSTLLHRKIKKMQNIQF
jgi:hypothetical protein